MPVSDGQLANAALFNGTYLDKTQDDTTIGKLGLNAPASGSPITNAQQEINDLKDEFNTSTGHEHDGIDSKKILATNLDSAGGLSGQVLQADGLGASSFVTLNADDIEETNTKKWAFKSNIDASNPLSSNDDTEGYSIGSRWFNSTTHELFIATNVTTASAVWVKVKVYISVGSVELVGASGQITLLQSADMTLKVQGDGAAQTASSTPFSGTPQDGMLIRVEGRDNTNTLTLVNNDSAGGCILNGDATLGKWDTITLRYDETDDRYIEQNRNF